MNRAWQRRTDRRRINITSIAASNLKKLRNFLDSSRSGTIALGGASSVVGKAVSLAAQIITVPLLVGYLGAEMYGAWVALLAIVMVLSSGDLGFGSALVSLIGRSAPSVNSARELVASAYWLGVALAVLLAIASLSALALGQFEHLSSTSSITGGPSGLVVSAVLVLGALAAIPFGVLYATLRGCQLTHIVSLCQMGTTVLSLFGLWVVVRNDLGIVGVAFALSGLPAIALVCYHAVFFATRMKELRPSMRFVSVKGARELLGAGSAFFVMQIAGVVGIGLQSVVIGEVCGPTALAEYSVAQRLAGIPLSVVLVVTGPLWPAFANAIGEGDLCWVRKSVRRATAMCGFAGAVVALALGFFGADVASLWLSDSVYLSSQVCFAIAIWAFVYSAVQPLAMLANGAMILRIQILVAVTFSILAPLAAYVGAKKDGVAGAFIYVTVVFIFVSILPQIVALKQKNLI